MLYHRIIKAATSGGENEGGVLWEEADMHGGEAEGSPSRAPHPLATVNGNA